MNIQAYSVAVRLAMDDQISRNLAMISNDAIKLNKRFVQMAKNIKALTAAANEAQRAFKAMNSAINNQFTGATKGANDYAAAMRSAANSAKDVTKANQDASRASGGPLPYMVGGAMVGGARSGQYIPRNNPDAAGLIGSSGRTYDGQVIRSGLPPVSPLMIGAGGSSGGIPPLIGGGLIAAGGAGGGRGNGWQNWTGGQAAGLSRNWQGWSNGAPPGGWGGGIPPGGGNSASGERPGLPNNSNGMANLATGYIGFKVLDGFVEEAAKYQTISEKFKQFKLGDQALVEAQKYAEAQKIKGTSDSEMLLMLTEAQGVFRQTHSLAAAEMAAPVMAKMNFAAQGLDPDLKAATTAKQMDMLRFIETAGGLKSPERFNELMNSGFKAIQSSGGNVDFTQYRQFMAKAGTSAFNLSEKALFAELEPIIGELKGSTAGDALMTSYNRLNGIIKLPNQVTHDLMQMGVWDKSKIELNDNGGVKRFKGNPLINSALFSQSPVDYYKQMILPIYQKQHLTEDQIQRENALIFGRTGGKMFNLIDKQLQTIEHSVEMFNQSRGLEETYGAVGGTYNGKKMDFDTKWENLQLVMGKDGGLLDVFTKGLTILTDTLQRLTDLSHKHPELTKLVAYSALAITGLAGLSGGVWLLKQAANALIGPLAFLVGKDGFPLLSKAMQGMPNIIAVAAAAIGTELSVEIYRRWQALKDGKPYDQIASQSEEMSELDRLKRRNWATNNPGVPYPDSSGMTGKIQYPSTPPKTSQPIQVHSTVNMDGKTVAQTVTTHQTKEATKPPAGVSAYDSSMTQFYSGQMSKLAPQ